MVFTKYYCRLNDNSLRHDAFAVALRCYTSNIIRLPKLRNRCIRGHLRLCICITFAPRNTCNHLWHHKMYRMKHEVNRRRENEVLHLFLSVFFLSLAILLSITRTLLILRISFLALLWRGNATMENRVLTRKGSIGKKEEKKNVQQSAQKEDVTKKRLSKSGSLLCLKRANLSSLRFVIYISLVVCRRNDNYHSKRPSSSLLPANSNISLALRFAIYARILPYFLHHLPYLHVI